MVEKELLNDLKLSPEDWVKEKQLLDVDSKKALLRTIYYQRDELIKEANRFFEIAEEIPDWLYQARKLLRL